MASKAGYNPLAGSVNEKNYSTNSQPQGPGIAVDIPEAQFQPPPVSLDELPKKDVKPGGANTTAQKPRPTNPNPDMAPLSEGEQEKAAEQMALFLVGAYEQVWKWVGSTLVINEKKQKKLEAEGLVDFSIHVPYSPTEKISLREALDEYNANASEIVKVDDEFKETIIPPLVRELKKRGHGLTDGQLILMTAGQNTLVNTWNVFQGRSAMKDFIAFSTEQTEIYRHRGIGPPAPVVHMERPVAPAPVVSQAAPIMTLQEKMMHEHQAKIHQDGVPQTGIPMPVEVAAAPVVVPATGQFGDPAVLKTMDEIYDKEIQEQTKKNKLREKAENLDRIEKKIPRAKKKSFLPPRAKKKGPGRPRKT